MRDDYDIIVLGGGISGITAAIEAAETGYRALLVEKLPYLGGKVAGINQYFPKLCPPYCGLEINFRRIRENSNIDVQTSTQIEKIEGSEGDFTAHLKTIPNHVNKNCTSCGECTSVCPVDRPDSFNLGLGKTKAIYLPHDLSFPSRYTIDSETCLKSECRKCLEACKYDAIDLDEKATEMVVHACSIIIATGWELYDQTKIPSFKFGYYPDVITSLLFERMAAPNGLFKGKIVRPSDGTLPKSIAFIQCSGSRDENHLPYCSGVCCSASLKQALFLADNYPDIRIRIYYIDMRVTGRNEDFLRKVQEHENIELIKGKIAEIKQTKDKKNLVLEGENILAGRKESTITDLVVLAGGIIPNQNPVNGLEVTNRDYNGTIELPQGIYATGCCKKPLDVSMSVKDATGTALKAIQSVVKHQRDDTG